MSEWSYSCNQCGDPSSGDADNQPPRCQSPYCDAVELLDELDRVIVRVRPERKAESEAKI